jgi:hypothetical protein
MKKVIIDKKRFFYVIIIVMIVDLIIDGIDDFGTRLYLIHLIRNFAIIGISLILSLTKKRD